MLETPGEQYSTSDEVVTLAASHVMLELDGLITFLERGRQGARSVRRRDDAMPLIPRMFGLLP